jgi:hypothetical protein
VDGIDGINAFTTVAVQFAMPAVSATVAVTVVEAAWIAIGQTLFVQFAGYLTVTNKVGNVVTLENPGYTENVAPATIIPVGAIVTPAGPQGDTGAAAPTTALYGVGSPEGAVVGSRGWTYGDTSDGTFYWKMSGDGTNTGLFLIAGP